jgi:rRNA processing protein Gar1
MPRIIGRRDNVHFEVVPDDFFQKAREQKKFFKELKELRKKEKRKNRRKKHIKN